MDVGQAKEPIAAPNDTHRVTLAQEWRDNWRVGLAAFLALSVSLGAFSSVASLFVIPLQQAFGWSRGQIAMANYASLASAACAPFLGRVVDRIGPRKIMLWGMAAVALVYAGMAAMSGSLGLYYLLFLLIQVIGLSFTGLTCSRVVSEVFVVSRGFSLAAGRSGMALATALLPAMLYPIIANFGWRAGYATLGLIIMILAWPAVYLWVGRSASRHASSRPSPNQKGPARWSELLRYRKVWFVCLGAALGYAPSSSLMTQLHPLILGKGIEAATAAQLVGLAGAASFVGAIITGALVDRLWAPAVAFVFACGSAAGCLLLATSASLSGEMASVAICLIGLGLGAEIDIAAFVVARYFGVRNFSSVYGMVAFSLSVSGAIGSALIGASYDNYGSYDAALIIIAVAVVLAGFVYLLLGRYPKPELSELKH